MLNKIKPLMVVRKTEAEKKEIEVSMHMTNLLKINNLQMF